LRGIPPKVAGAARIRVTFTLDADGLLTVSAEETTTKTKQSIHVKPSYGLEEDELESMIRAGFENAEDDMTLRLINETVVDANRLLHSIEGAMDQDPELLNAEETTNLNSLLGELRLAIENKDRDILLGLMKQIEKATETFAQRRMDKSIGQALTGQNIETVLKP
jgi:molecular chaperone HscA